MFPDAAEALGEFRRFNYEHVYLRPASRQQADAVIAGTPIDLGALLNLRLPVVRARYGFAELDDPGLGDLEEETICL